MLLRQSISCLHTSSSPTTKKYNYSVGSQNTPYCNKCTFDIDHLHVLILLENIYRTHLFCLDLQQKKKGKKRKLRGHWVRETYGGCYDADPRGSIFLSGEPHTSNVLVFSKFEK